MNYRVSQRGSSPGDAFACFPRVPKYGGPKNPRHIRGITRNGRTLSLIFSLTPASPRETVASAAAAAASFPDADLPRRRPQPRTLSLTPASSSFLCSPNSETLAFGRRRTPPFHASLCSVQRSLSSASSVSFESWKESSPKARNRSHGLRLLHLRPCASSARSPPSTRFGLRLRFLELRGAHLVLPKPSPSSRASRSSLPTRTCSGCRCRCPWRRCRRPFGSGATSIWFAALDRVERDQSHVPSCPPSPDRCSTWEQWLW
jgi:hypothetical protein